GRGELHHRLPAGLQAISAVVWRRARGPPARDGAASGDRGAGPLFAAAGESVAGARRRARESVRARPRALRRSLSRVSREPRLRPRAGPGAETRASVKD